MAHVAVTLMQLLVTINSVKYAEMQHPELYKCHYIGNLQPVPLSSMCCSAVESTCADSCCEDEDGIFCECCAGTESVVPAGHDLSAGDTTCRMIPTPDADGIPIDKMNSWNKYKFYNHSTMFVDLQEFCCESLSRLGKCSQPAVCCHTDTKPFCECSAPAGSLFKYRSIKSQRPGSVIVSKARIMAAEAKMKKYSNTLCFKDKMSDGLSGGGGTSSWVDLSKACCDVKEATFSGECCHLDGYEYCNECADDTMTENKTTTTAPSSSCLIQVTSSEMSIVNEKLSSREIVLSVSSICCSIYKFKNCTTKDSWPFCRQGSDSDSLALGSIEPQSGRRSRQMKRLERKQAKQAKQRAIQLYRELCSPKPTCSRSMDPDTFVPYDVDMVSECCKMMKCKPDKCYHIDRSPFCKCRKSNPKGRKSPCNVSSAASNRKSCFVRTVPPMMILTRDLYTNPCDTPLFVYEICCVMRQCEKTGGNKTECCISGDLSEKGCHCCIRRDPE